MPRGRKVSRPLIANMIFFVDINNFYNVDINSHRDIQCSKLGYLRS